MHESDSIRTAAGFEMKKLNIFHNSTLLVEKMLLMLEH